MTLDKELQVAAATLTFRPFAGFLIGPRTLSARSFSGHLLSCLTHDSYLRCNQVAAEHIKRWERKGFEHGALNFFCGPEGVREFEHFNREIAPHFGEHDRSGPCFGLCLCKKLRCQFGTGTSFNVVSELSRHGIGR